MAYHILQATFLILLIWRSSRQVRGFILILTGRIVNGDF